MWGPGALCACLRSSTQTKLPCLWEGLTHIQPSAAIVKCKRPHAATSMRTMTRFSHEIGGMTRILVSDLSAADDGPQRDRTWTINDSSDGSQFFIAGADTTGSGHVLHPQWNARERWKNLTHSFTATSQLFSQFFAKSFTIPFFPFSKRRFQAVVPLLPAESAFFRSTGFSQRMMVRT